MFATDFTYDLFMEDAHRYNATMCRGVYDNGKDARKAFMRYFKGVARDFEAVWMERYGRQYDRHAGYIGDAFMAELTDWFSDYYKETYRQRPHLPAWFYVQAVGFPCSEDTARTFCATPVESAEAEAKRIREEW